MRRKHPRSAAPVADATATLDDAELAEVLLRFPSPATLARAALVCRRWRRVAFAPAFLRRFRLLHPPPLLGFLVCRGGRPYQHYGGLIHGEELDRGPLPVLDPTFVPVVVPLPGIGDAVGRCRDFSLSSLPDVDHWALADAQDGLLLLCSSCERPQYHHEPELRDVPRHFAVCNPLSGRSVVLPEPGNDLYLGSYHMGAALDTIGGEDNEGGTFSFEVLLATYCDGPMLCAFSSSTGEWAMLPCPAIKNLHHYGDRKPWIDDGASANGCFYWVVHDWEFEYEHLLVLDTRTKKFSTLNMPRREMCTKYERNVRVMRSDDGELRLVAMVRSSLALHFWRRDTSRSTKGRWLKEDAVKFASVAGMVDLIMCGDVVTCWLSGSFRMIDVVEGFVFFKHHDTPWIFVLNLKEMKLQKLPSREKYSGYALPYRMDLSPPLPNFDQQGNH